MNNSEHQPLFSIITPTCKHQHLLKRALKSVLSQTYSNFEIIVVNDNPNDDTASQIIAEFDDIRIKYICHEKNMGACVAYNNGMRLAKGEYIAFLDDDDEYLPEFLEKTKQFFIQKPEISFSWCGIQRILDTKEGERILLERSWEKPFRNVEEALIQATSIGNGFGVVMKRKCLEIAGYYDELFRVAEDTEYLFRLARKFDFAVIPETLVKIHQHGVTQLTSHLYDSIRLVQYEKIMQRNADLLNKYPELFCVHADSMVRLAYKTRNKKKGCSFLLKMLLRRPYRLRILFSILSYELSGSDFHFRKIFKEYFGFIFNNSCFSKFWSILT
ncbi:MAG: glycosyltransferase family 2 protein [Candidatus Riflebacteria bacterium]|nr:glycosyltransferase family 2 protein [Candidatus Riflebacteria bacterium]